MTANNILSFSNNLLNKKQAIAHVKCYSLLKSAILVLKQKYPPLIFSFAHEYYYRNSYKKRTYDSLCHNKCSESDSIVKANKTEKKTGKQTVNGTLMKRTIAHAG